MGLIIVKSPLLSNYEQLPNLIIDNKSDYNHTEVETGKQDPGLDANAEMLIAIPDRVPSQFLVPPPFPPPVSVLIRRKTPGYPMSARRYFQDPRPFAYSRSNNRLPVTSIQDILSQFEQETKDYQRIAPKKPKRINFYGRYKHRPNRPKVIPIPYANEETSQPAPAPMRDSSPSVANDVNHLIAHNLVPQREPPQLFYPNPIVSQSASPPSSPSSHGNGLYQQIIATNKYRHETAKDAKPFSLMLDIYPMNEENKTKPVTTTSPQLLTPPKLPPLQIDPSYYNSINFHQLNQASGVPYISSTEIPSSPSDQPEQMVVHLNLYPTKKKTPQFSPPTDPIQFFSESDDEMFMPIINPQVYYHSRSSEDEENKGAFHVPNNEEVVDIPRRLHQVHASIPQPMRTGKPRVHMIKTINFGPPINVTDYQTTIAPQTINKLIYDEIRPNYSTYLGQYNSNEIGRRIDDQSTTMVRNVDRTNWKISPTRTNATPTRQYNSHQPENPMKVETLSLYTGSISNSSGGSSGSGRGEEPSRKTISS